MQQLIRWVFVAALPLAGCAPVATGGDGGGQPDFLFATLLEREFTITVVDVDGTALAGMAVVVEDVFDPTLSDDTENGHRVYLSGVTDPQGRLSGVLRVPAQVRDIDVVVHDDAGRSGPWTDTALRTDLGDFARVRA